MAKVNTIMYNQIYTSSNNPNMHFHVMVRSYDGTDRKSADIKDDQFINGSIDGVDVMSDCLTTEDHYQSEHIILRPKEERVFNGHDYRMIESLVNSCDIATIPDWEIVITDNKGKERHCRQLYTKAADDKTVHVKSYVEGILVDEDYFNYIYTPTDYSDEGPRRSCLDTHSANYEEVQNKLRTMVETGQIVEKIKAPDTVQDTYTTHGIKYYYNGTWTVEVKPNGANDYVNEVTFTLKYGTTKKTSVLFSETPVTFTDENYGASAETLANIVNAETGKLKTFLDGIAVAGEIQIPPDVTGFYRAGKVSYYYWLHYDSRVQESDDEVTTTVSYVLRWGTDDCSNKFSSNKKSYDTSNYALASVELVEEGKGKLNELFDYLDNLTGVKLVTGSKKCYQKNTVNYAGSTNRINTDSGNEIVTLEDKTTNTVYTSHEVGAHPRDPGGKALVLTAHEFEEGIDSNIQAMLHLDGDTLVDETGSSWTSNGGAPITTAENAAMGKGLLVSDGRYIVSKTVILGPESFTVDFFAFTDENCPNDACLCDIKHPSYDIKIKLLKQLNSKTQETDITMGFYVNNELKLQSKVDIIISGAICHYAVVYQKAAKKIFFFINGILIGQQEEKEELPQGATQVYFNRDTTTGKSTFIGTLDEIRISTGLARWAPDLDFQDYEIGVVHDEKNIEWHMYARDPKSAKAETTTPAEFVKAEEGQDKFGTGIVFDGQKYAYMATPLTLGGTDFSIDFWVNITKPGSNNGGIFEIEIGNREYILGFHDYGSEACVHDSNGTQQKMTAIKSAFRHVAIVYVQKTGRITFYSNGEVAGKKKEIGAFDPRGKLKTESTFRLKIGRYQGSGTTGYLIGTIDEFRIESGRIPSMFLDSNGNLLSKFTPPTEPYELDQTFTKALLRSSAFGNATVGDEELEVDNPNYIFNPPKTPYNIPLQPSGKPLGLISYYVPLTKHFDDDKFSYVEGFPEQVNVPKYDGVTVWTPEWKNYDPQALLLEGEPDALQSKEAGDHYVSFRPYNDHLWADSKNDKPRIVKWTVRRDQIEAYPEQAEPLEYNGNKQHVNLVNFDETKMTLSETVVEAVEANSFNDPYICQAIPKPGLCWFTGMAAPHDIYWIIEPKRIAQPVLKETSFLDFVYDGSEKEPVFEYDPTYIEITGVTKATNPNSKHIDGSLLTKEYKITFSLKDKKNTCWLAKDNNTDSEEQHEGDGDGDDDDHVFVNTNGGTDDISFVWKIRRKPIPIFTVTNTTLVYKPEEQGPTITPSTWNTDEVVVTDYRKQPVRGYTAVFRLVDITKYEWEDGETGDRQIDWEITKAQATLTLSSYSVALKAPPIPPTADITITKTGTGALSCSSDDFVRSEIKDNILTLAGIRSTELGTPSVLTVTLAGDNNYIGTTATIEVTVELGLESLSWQQIADKAADGTLLNFTYIGDMKTVKLKTKLPVPSTEGSTVEYDDSDDYAVKMILIGIDHNPDFEGNKKAHFMLGKMGMGKDIVLPNNKNIPVFTATNNAYGWRNSNLNLQLNIPGSGICYSDIFPEDFLAVVTPCLKWTDNTGGGKNNAFFVTPTLDWVSIPSEYEVFGTSSYSNSEELKYQQRYSYFDNGGATKRERTDGKASNGWALRSVTKSSNSQVAAVNNKGNLVSVPVKSILDITPVFTVSRKTADPLKIPAIDQCVETLMHFDDPSDPFKDECRTTFNIIDLETGNIKDAVISDQKAKFGSALQFDGQTYAVQQRPIELGGQDFTIDFWVNFDRNSSQGDQVTTFQSVAFALSAVSGSHVLHCYRVHKQELFGINLTNYYSNTNNVNESKSAWQRTDFDPFDQWVHVAIVYEYDKKTLFVYFNGKLTTHKTTGKKNTTIAVFNKLTLNREKYVLYLGTKIGHNTAMIGAVDELRIQNGLARWKPPAWAYERQATTNDADRFVFDPPTFAGETSESDVLHNQVTDGYIVKLNNNIKEKELVITEHVGTVHVRNSHPSVASAVFDTDTRTITIKGISPGTTTITIYTDDTDTTYGVVRVIDVICEATVDLPKLNECDPADIKTLVKENTATKAWSIGDITKDIRISGTIGGQSVDTNVNAVLIGINHNKDKETAGNYNAHFMISLPVSFPVNSSATNEGGWYSSEMRQDFCAQFLNCLPTAWKNMISYCSKYTDNKGTGTDKTESDITSTQDRVFLPSEYEIFGQVLKGNNLEVNEQQRYSYFNDVTHIPVTWTRSPVRSTSSNSFVRSNGTGAVATVADQTEKVVFCFSVSDYAEPVNLDAEVSDFTVAKDNVTFDGADHNAVEEGIVTTAAGSKLNAKYHKWTGEYTGNTARSYTMYVRPATGYLWNDGTDTPKPVTWTIKAANAENITASNTNVRLYYANPSETIDITRNNDSKLQVNVTDSTLVDYIVDGNKVTLTPTGLGTTTVIVTSPAKGNYGEGTVTITVSASDVKALDKCTPAEIQTVVLTGKAGLAWDVGDNTADIKIKGTVNKQNIDTTVKAYILGFNHNGAKEGTKKMQLCLGRTTEGQDTGLVSLTVPSGYNGYTGTSAVLKEACEEFFNCLPAIWQAVISSTEKYVESTGSSGFVTFNTTWLMSREEIFGPDDENSKQYQYYKNANSKIRKVNSSAVSWFTRSLNNGKPVTVSTAGKSVENVMTAYVVPCFAIGSTLPSPDLRTDKDSIATDVGSSDTLTVSRNGTGVISAVSSDTAIATVSVSGSTVTVTGVKTGSCNVTIKVAKTSTYSLGAVTIPVTIGAVQKTKPTLDLNPTSLTITKGSKRSSSFTVTGGTVSSVTSADSTIAKATLTNDKITVEGINEGATHVTVAVKGDSTHYDMTKDIAVTVTSVPPVVNNIPANYDYDAIKFKNDMIYDTTEQSVSEHLTGYSPTYHDLSGDLQATNHNDQTYVVTVTPKSGWQWQSGNANSKNIDWNIQKADAKISGSNTVTLVKDKTMSTAITYTITGNGTLSVKSNSNSSLVTATVSGNKVTFKSACTSNDTVTVTLQTSETVNYKPATLEVTVTVSMSALEVLDSEHNSLKVDKPAATYDEQTTYSIKTSSVNSWIPDFNSTYHTLSRVTDNSNVTVTNKTASGVTTYSIQDAGTYKIWIKPAAKYAWDNTGSTEEKSFSWTINRKSLGVTTATQKELSGTGTAMTYNGSAQTPKFDVQDKVDVKVTARTDAKTYSATSEKATVTPKANYCWSDGDTGAKTVSWTIKRCPLTTKDDPVQKTVFVYSSSTITPKVEDFTFDSDKITFTSCTGKTNAGTYKDTDGAYFTPTGNYCWSDLKTTKKAFPWKISPLEIPKPTLSAAYNKPYNGSPHKPVINNNITASTTYVTVTASNYLAIAYKPTNKTGYDTSENTTVNFTPTNAGKYKIIYTLQKNKSTVTNVTWKGGSTGAVSISFEVTKATIPAADVPKKPANLTVQYNLNDTPISYISQKPAFDVSAKYTYTCKGQSKAGTYENTDGATFTPTANYQWLTSTQKDTIAPLHVPWTIDLADGFVEVTLGKVKPSALTNSVYTTTFTATGSGPIVATVDKEYIAKVTKSSSTFTVKGLGEGSATITLRAKAKAGYSKTASVTVPVTLTVVHEPMSATKPWTFMRNFLQHLIWYNCEDYYVNMLVLSNKKIDGKTITYPANIYTSTRNALDFAVNKLTNGDLKTMQAVVDKMKSFANKLKTSATNAEIDASLKTNYNIDLSNADRGSIFGYDIKASESQIDNKAVVKEIGSIGSYPSTTTVIDGVTYTISVIEGITVKWPNDATDSDGTKRTTLTDKEKYAIKALNTWWLKIPLQMIDDYYGININGPFCGSKTLSVYIKPMDDGVLATGGMDLFKSVEGESIPVTDTIFKDIYGITDAETKAKYSSSLTAKYMECLNMMMNLGVDEISKMNKDNDGTMGTSADDSQAMDLTVAHELIHCLLYNNLRFHGQYPTWFKESTAEILWGVDFRTVPLRRLACNANLLQQMFDANEHLDTTGLSENEELIVKNYPYVFAYMLFRYLIKNYCKS